MKPLHFKVPRLKEETVRVERWNLDNFFDPIHFHEEFQITLILEGEGSLFVGDSVVPFREGEIYMFGKNLPHVLRNGKTFNQSDNHKHSRAISVFFSEDVIKSALSNIPEAYAIQRLIDFSIYGIKLSKELTSQISKDLKVLTKKKGFEKIITLLNILEKISKDNKLQFISSTGIPLHTVIENIPKITRVFDYIRKKLRLNKYRSLSICLQRLFADFLSIKVKKLFLDF